MALTFESETYKKNLRLYCWSDKELTSADKPEGNFENDDSNTRQTVFIETDNWTLERTSQPDKNMSEWTILGRTQLAMGGRIWFYDPEKVESN